MRSNVIINKSARYISAMALNRFERAIKNGKRNSTYTYAADFLAPMLRHTKQRARATDLLMGVVRNRSALDLILSAVGETPSRRIDAEIINILRIGIYELVYRPETANYSIINEAVENAKKLKGQKQANFVNAVLRKISKAIKDRSVALPHTNPRKIIPHNDSRGCLFDKKFLPDINNQPDRYLSNAFSIPHWLIEQWLNDYGREQTFAACIASNRRPCVYLRPNKLQTTTYHLAELLTEASVDYEIMPDDYMVKANNPGIITALPGFAEGLFTVQDLAAAQPVVVFNPKENSKILDLCAAPGTKTTQLAEFTNDNARIWATDIDPDRLDRLKSNLERLKTKSVKPIEINKIDQIAEEIGLFDTILLDVPCSNTGVLAKRPEVRLRLKEKSLEKLLIEQAELLKKAAGLLASKGRICYSTCSIMNQENRQMIDVFLNENNDFKLLKDKLTIPAIEPSNHDGGYYAILAKK